MTCIESLWPWEPILRLCMALMSPAVLVMSPQSVWYVKVWSRCWRLLTQVLFSLCLFFSFFGICEPKWFKASTAVVPVEWSLPAGIWVFSPRNWSLRSKPIIYNYLTWPCFTGQPNSSRKKRPEITRELMWYVIIRKSEMNSPATQYISGKNTT